MQNAITIQNANKMLHQKNEFVMTKYILPVVVFLVITSTGIAQNIEFKSGNFKDNKEGLKVAVDNIDAGDAKLKAVDELLQNKKDPKMLYEFALSSYLKANEFNPNNAELNFKIGKCYINTYFKQKSIPHFEKAIALNPEIDKEVYLLYGKALQFALRFDDAIKQLKLYKTKLSGGQLEDQKSAIDKSIAECENGKQMVASPKRVWVNSLDKINTQYNDYGSYITTDEAMMIFNSRKPETTGGGKSENGDFNSDIYVSYKQQGAWTTPENIQTPLNTNGDDECLALAPDGQAMFVYKNTNGNGDIYISKLNGDAWSSPEKLPDMRINTEFNETHASFSYDGIKRYFISDQQGNKDIYFSGAKDAKINDWGKGQKIGFGLNTNLDESSIFMHPDGKTLYFSSKAFNSMGGYDIFKSEWMEVGQWSPPVNMGFPINTPYDEQYFVMAANGKNAYISSNREEGKGELDIYRVRFLGPLKPAVIDNEDHLLASFVEPIRDAKPEGPVQVETMNLTVLRGRTLDSYTNQPVEAEIEIVDNVKNVVVYSIRSNSKTGKFLVSLPAGVNYGIAVKADKYLFHSENFDLPKMADYQLVDKDILLKNVCIGCTIILRNIFFDFGKADLKPESTMELQRLVKLMNDIPQIKVEISGHTDNVGSDAANVKLSDDRAKSVVNYLIKEGVPAGRLIAKGYGASKPLAGNETNEGRQLNRRTEFKIVEN